MTDRSFTTTLILDQTPEQAFAAITNPRGWWSESIEGPTDKLGAVFNYHFKDFHRARIEVTELIPGQKVVWHVLENYFSFTQDKAEWTGTTIEFDIAKSAGRTEIRFTHQGLVPEYECYGACSDGWGTYIGTSLRDLIATGKGEPNVGDAVTDTERALSA